MPIAVIRTYANYSILSARRFQEYGGAGACAAVMSNLQYVAAEIHVVIYKLFLHRIANIASKEESEAAVLNENDKRGIVRGACIFPA